MARPRKTLTDDQVAQVEKLAAVLNQEQIADVLGIHDATLRRRMKDDPRVLRAYKKGRASAASKIAASLLQKALAGDTTSAIFYLKTQCGWRESKETDTSFVYDPDRFTVEGNQRVANGEAPHIVAASGGLKE
jgi:hypothetical protein